MKVRRHHLLHFDLVVVAVEQDAFAGLAVSDGVWERGVAHVTHHTSHITNHTSHVTHHTSHVTRHTSHVTRHTSHITHHTSHITHHTSHITSPASTACFLVVPLHRLRHRTMYYKPVVNVCMNTASILTTMGITPHVRLIDSHTECDGCANDFNFV